jgi:AcrR family transcriptional regulator
VNALRHPGSGCKTVGMTEKPSARQKPMRPPAGSRTAGGARRGNPAGLETLRDVARREFVASGFHAVSIRDLAREAGLSLSALYHYHSSKQELLYGVLDDAIDKFHAILRRRMDGVDTKADPVVWFLVLVHSTVEYRAVCPEESLLFIREQRNLESPYAERLTVRRNEVGALYTAAIEAGVEAGVFTTPYPVDARRAILAMLNAIPNWYRASGGIDVETLVARYQRLALVILEYRGSPDEVVASQALK